MSDTPPRSNGHARPPETSLAHSAEPVGSGIGPPAADSRPPLVLTTFAPRRDATRYREAAVFSLVTHLSLIGLAVGLGREAVHARPELTAVVLKRPPPPRRPPRPQPPPQEIKRGGRGRGVALPAAVAPDIQADLEISFAANPDPAPGGPVGGWLGSSSAHSGHAGWADGLGSGTVIKRSLARDPFEKDTVWECDFPDGADEGKVVIRLRIHVSAAGVPTRVTVVRPGPPAFNKSAVECARRQAFRPALDVNGQPCDGVREVGILYFRMGSGVTIGAPAKEPAGSEHEAPSKVEASPESPTSG